MAPSRPLRRTAPPAVVQAVRWHRLETPSADRRQGGELLVGELDRGRGGVVLEVGELEVPGIGSITGERLQQPGQGELGRRGAVRRRDVGERASSFDSWPVASGNHGMKPIPCASQ